MKVLYIIIFSFFCLNSGLRMHAAGNANPKKVRLLQQLSKLPVGDTLRLEVLYRLSLNAKEYPVREYYARKLLKEAGQLNNYQYICNVYLTLIATAYNNYDAKKVNYWMGCLEPVARKQKMYDELFLGKRCVIDMLLLTDQYELDEKMAKEMLEEAQSLNNVSGMIVSYQCLANLYRMTYRLEEAVDVLEKAYKLTPKATESLTIEILKSLVAAYTDLKDMPNWLKWVRIQESYLKQIVKKDPRKKTSVNGWFLLTYISYVNYYTSENDMKQAEKYLLLAEEYNSRKASIYSYYYSVARFNYYWKMERWEDALVENEKLLSIFKNVSSHTYVIMHFYKAKLLARLGEEDRALEIYKQAFVVRDSLKLSILNKQSDQLKQDYNAEQLLLKKEKINRNVQIVILVFVGVILLILIVFVIHAYRVRGKLKRSENEMRRITEELEKANVAKEAFLSNISTGLSTPLNEVVDQSMQLASGSVVNDEMRKDISASINKTSVNLMRQINNILDLSRLEAGMMKYRDENVDLLMIIKNWLSTIEPTLNERLSMSLPEKVSLPVRLDVVRFQEVLDNLLQTSPGELFFTVTHNIDSDEVYFCVMGSILCSDSQDQEVVLANEVNRLLMEHFGGQYRVDTRHLPVSVRFVIPLLKQE